MLHLKSPGWIGIVVPGLMVPQSQITYEGPLEGIFDVRLSGQRALNPMLSGRSAALFWHIYWVSEIRQNKNADVS